MVTVILNYKGFKKAVQLASFPRIILVDILGDYGTFEMHPVFTPDNIIKQSGFESFQTKPPIVKETIRFKFNHKINLTTAEYRVDL